MSTAYTDLIRKPDLQSLETASLPLSSIEWQLFTSLPDLVATWPPSRFSTRNARVSTYDALYNSDFSVIMNEKPDSDNPAAENRRLFRVSGDTLRAYIETISDIINATPIQLSAPDLINQADLDDFGFACVVDQLKYSGSYIISGVKPDGEYYISQANPGAVYPLEDGGYITVSPRVSSDAPDTSYNVADVLIALGTGATIKRVYGYTAGDLGEIKETQNYGISYLTAVPSMGRWGSSFIDRMLKTVVELGITYGRTSHTLNKASDPILRLTAKRDQLAALAKDPSTNRLRSRTEQQERYSGEQGIENKLKDADKVARDWIRLEYSLTDDFVTELDYVTFNGELEPGLNYAQLLEQKLAEDTGIPGWLVRASEIPASGVSLDRQLIRLHTMTKRLQSRTRVAIENALNKLFAEGTIEVTWDNYLDELSAPKQSAQPSTPTTDEDETPDPESEVNDG